MVCALALTLALAACSGAAPETPTKGAPKAPEAEMSIFENKNMRLPVPTQYESLLIVNTPGTVAEGVLFEVFERASVEAEKAQGGKDVGAGWLFSIERISETALRRKLCYDMSGEEAFAKDGKGGYYMYCHPTDVRFVRESYDNIEADMAQWSELNAWGAGLPDSFIAENKGLTPEKYGNTMIDMYLARIAYMGAKYTLSTKAGGVMEPGRMDVKPYLDRLTDGVTFEYADADNTPAGEYVSLQFSDEDTRFDFFTAAGGENYIRVVVGDDMEELYKASYAGKATRAGAVVSEWYAAMTAAKLG